MRAALTAVALAVVALIVGCSQPVSPSSVTSVPSTSSSIAPSAGNAASPVGRAAAGTVVPFKGSLEGVAIRTPLTPPFVSLVIDATGNATHLGRFTFVNEQIVNTAARTLTGSHEFTAADGDVLTADFTGQFGPTQNPRILLVVETATITGGTGRFADATGSYTVERLLNLDTLTTSASFEGTMSSVGASKH